MSGPDPAVAAVRVAVRRVLRALPEGSFVLTAVSGGADSLALAAAVAFLAPRLGIRAGAVVVDHGLQPGSDAVAGTAALACRDLGLAPVVVVPVQVAATGDGPEAAARDARYAALHGEAGRLGAAAVLLGHTRDDQAESVLLGLARGSGTRSLAGMAAQRGLLHRPLLQVSRSTTTQACAALGLHPWQDPHNGDAQFARARVRAAMPHLTAALGPGVVPALARSADLARDDADALDALAGDAFREVAGAAVRALSVPGRPPGLAVLDLVALHPALRRRVLHLAATAAGCPPGRVVSAHVMAVDALLTAWHGQGPVALPGGVRVVRRCDRLLFVDDKDMGDDLAKVLISREQIATRLAEIATQIDADYAGRDLLLVGVLKGAVMVMADLARAVSHPAEMDWMAVSSYGSGTKSSGVVRILKDLDQDITGRNVLIVEDVIDSGLTLSWLLSNLRSRGPESVEVCALLRKPSTAKVAIDVRYVGFDIEPDFVVGYGLDYQQRYRNLPFVGLLSPKVYS